MGKGERGRGNVEGGTWKGERGTGNGERGTGNEEWDKHFDVLATTHIKLLYISADADRFRSQNHNVSMSRRETNAYFSQCHGSRFIFFDSLCTCPVYL